MADEKSGQGWKHARLCNFGAVGGIEQYGKCKRSFIRQGLSPAERLHQLNQIAITQMRSLIDNNEVKRLTEGD